MSLQVKFPFGRGHAPQHTCRTCGYMTRHRAMFERHTKRCNSQTMSSPQRTPSSQPLPSPPVCRNYRCEKCGFATSKSKLYLQHRRELHGENFSIYPCDQCEYASRHKSKVIRHRSLVHKDVPSDPGFPKELDSSQKNTEIVDVMALGKERSDIKMEYESVDEDDDCYMQLDENQNTPVKKKPRLMAYDTKDHDSAENSMLATSAEDTESPSGATFIPDPTEDAYKYILSKSDDVGSPLYVCSLCTYNNSHKWKVATHVRNVHMRKTLFKCPYCEFVTERKIEWCVHKTAHTEKAVHSCQECSYRTTMKRNFERHLAHHVMDGPFKCTLCTYSSTGEAAVQRHMAEYHPSPDKQLAIDSIHTSNGTTSVMTKSPPPSPLIIGSMTHMSATSNDGSHKSSSKIQGSPVPSTGHEVQCKLCSVWFKNETRLRIHMVSHSDEAPHVCPICKLRYKRPADLNRHMKRKHGTKVEDLSSDIEQDQPLDLCVKKSDDELDLDPEKPLDLTCKSSSSSSPSPSHVYRTSEIKCSYCSYLAKWPSDLRRHMLVHSIEKRFHCHVCSKKYKYQFDLNMHMRKSHRLQAGRTRVSSAAAFGRDLASASTPKDGHELKIRQLRRSQPKESQQLVEEHYTETGIPNILKCSYCDYIGKYPAEVHRHELLHIGSQPYLCLFCTYRTFWKGDVKRHLVKHHKSEVDKYGELPELVNLCYKPQGCQTDANVEKMMDDDTDFENSEEFDQEEDIPRKGIQEEMKPYLKDIDGRMLYKCPKCSLAYELPMKLKNHMEIHEDLKRFMCPHCGKRSNWKWDILKHIKVEHTDPSSAVIELTESEAKATLDEYLNSLQSDSDIHIKEEDTSNDPEEKDQIDDVETLASIQGLDDYARVMNPESIEDDEELKAPFYKKPHTLLDSIPGGPHSLGSPESGVDTLIATVAAGRYRRFKCSLCGKRSNWKWDIKKHIRCTHHSAQVIEMTEDEAKATFHEVLQLKGKDDIYRFEEEGDDQEARPKWRPFKCPVCGKRSNIKSELKKHMMECAPDSEMIVLSEAEAEATFVAECGHYTDRKQEDSSSGMKVTLSPDPGQHFRIGPMMKVKKYKCSVCPYRSDYRSDISRHLKRKHHKVKGKILILGAEYAAATLPSYKNTWAKKKFVITPEKVQDLQEEGNTDDLDHCVRVVDPDEEEKPKSVGLLATMKSDLERDEMTIFSSGRSPNRVWQCSKCDYRNNNKMVIVSHFKTHGQGHAFQCKVCPYTSDYRGSIYRHVKAIHKRRDYQNVISYCALMEVDTDSSPNGSIQPECVEGSDAKQQTDSLDVVYVVKMFQCKLCPSKTIHKHNLVRHIKEKHPDVSDPHSKVSEVETITRKPPTASASPKSRMKLNRDTDKVLKCDICPFKTMKYGLLKIHAQYHNPQNGEKFKCKYCPFYVSTMRRLIQHMQLHEERPKEDGQSSQTSGTGQVVSLTNSPSRSGGKARHFCEKCPYVSINKNDFIYHKQFHRPKPAAPFKCEFCPYWVSLRRLLTQHKKVHSPEYKLQYYPRDMITAQDKENSSQEKSNPSPAKSDQTTTSLEVDDVVEVAQLKQQIIMSKIMTVPITPEKLKSPKLMDRADDMIMRGYLIDTSGHVIMNKSYQKLHKCRYCPYTNVRLANLCLHEKMHGRDGSEKELYQCNYCDYQVGNKGLLSHHVKVHSIQYQPGKDEINDVESLDENMETVSKPKQDDDGENSKTDEENNNNNAVKFPERSTIQTELSSHLEVDQLPNRAQYYIKFDEQLRGPVLEKATIKKWCCEQCPYATVKRSQFEKHILLHGSRQKYPCEFCDYSVPGYHLLLQHKRLHLMPNHNLLSVQSVSNLRRLPEVPADIATAAQFGKHELELHDNLDLYENSPDFVEPKKLFRCDRCPYTNSRRDHLLSHLKFHMIRSDLRCPYCDYSVSKVHLLNQHIKVHFSTPGSEMSAEPKPKNDLFSKKELDQPDFFTALELKQLRKQQPTEDEQPTDLSVKNKPVSQTNEITTIEEKTMNENINENQTLVKDAEEIKENHDDDDDDSGRSGDSGQSGVEITLDNENGENIKDSEPDDEKAVKDTKDDKIDKAVVPSDAEANNNEEKQDAEGKKQGNESEVKNVENDVSDKVKDSMDEDKAPAANYEADNVCKYCDRCFTSSEKLTCHEKQHLLGSELTAKA